MAGEPNEMPHANCVLRQGRGWQAAPGGAACQGENALNPTLLPQGLPAHYWTATLDSFILLEHHPARLRRLGEALLSACVYGKRYPEVAPPGLLLLGPPGSGKTHLAVGTLRRLGERGYAGLFWDYQEFLDQVVEDSYRQRGAGQRSAAYREAQEADVLLLDDFGSCQARGWLQDRISSLLRHRCNHGKPLLITVNHEELAVRLLDPRPERPPSEGERQELAKRLHESTLSRLFEMCRLVCLPGGADFRKVHRTSDQSCPQD